MTTTPPTRWNVFLAKLYKEGYSLRLLWSSQRNENSKYEDVFCYQILGDSDLERPGIHTMIVVNYEVNGPPGQRDGFGLWFESPTNNMAKDIEMIKKGIGS